MRQLLERASLPGLRQISLPPEQSGYLVAPSTTLYAYRNAAGEEYFRRWVALTPGQPPHLLLKANDTFTRTNRSFSRPEGYYIYADPASQSLIPLTVSKDERQIIAADPNEAQALLQDMVSCIPKLRGHAEMVRNVYLRSRRHLIGRQPE